MPETTINKQGESCLPENKNWLAEDHLIPPPAGDFVLLCKIRRPRIQTTRIFTDSNLPTQFGKHNLVADR